MSGFDITSSEFIILAPLSQTKRNMSMGYLCVMAYVLTIFCYCFSGTLLRMWIFPFRLRPGPGAFRNCDLWFTASLKEEREEHGASRKAGAV